MTFESLNTLKSYVKKIKNTMENLEGAGIYIIPIIKKDGESYKAYCNTESNLIYSKKATNMEKVAQKEDSIRNSFKIILDELSNIINVLQEIIDLTEGDKQ